jgi:hypothetical protein
VILTHNVRGRIEWETALHHGLTFTFWRFRDGMGIALWEVPLRLVKGYRILKS